MATEAVIVLPLLVFIMLGAIDIAQYINLAQLVSNSSREGARVASRIRTTTVQEIEQTVENYLKEIYPDLSDEQLAAAVSITVLDKNNSFISNGDLSNIESGDRMSVNVSFDFSAVRWLSGPDYWNGNVNSSSTVCRRE